jgi:hypothetical protein
VADHDEIRDGATTDGGTEATTMKPETMNPETADPETVDPETVDSAVISNGSTERAARRRGPDPLTLLVGLATLAMAVFAFVGDVPDLSGFDPRWLLAGGAALVGLMLLVGSLRGRRGGG